MSMLTWLEGLGRRRSLPSSPERRELREYASLLAALRRDLPDVDQRLRNSDLDAAWFAAQLETQADHYREKLLVAYTVVGCLLVIIFAMAWP